MTELAPTVWPAGQRKIICYSTESDQKKVNCLAKEGNPFGPFWDRYHIDFDEDVGSQLHYGSEVHEWARDFPASSFPVVALKGAPAAFPVNAEHRHLQKYIVWNSKTKNNLEAYVNAEMARPFIAVHGRIGQDWVNACKHGIGQPYYMESTQCSIPDKITEVCAISQGL